MNLRKNIIVIGGSCLLIALLAIKMNIHKKLFNNNTTITSNNTNTKINTNKNSPAIAITKETPQTPPAVSKQVIAKPKEEIIAPPIIEDKKELSPLGLGDPFNYSFSDDDNSSFSNNSKSVGQISIKGIIRLKDKEPVAILQVNETGKCYYVKTGNVIRLEKKATNNKNNKNNASSIIETYIVVKSIKNDEVELIQQELPDRIIIVR